MAGAAAPAAFTQARPSTPTPAPMTSPAMPSSNVFGMASQGLQQAMSGASSAMRYTPQQVTAATTGATGYRAPTITGVSPITAERVGAANVAGVSPITAERVGAANVAGVSPITAQTVTSGQLAGTSLSPYMNPFISDVIEQTAADLERQRQIQQGDIGAQATAARAFGGSRQGIAEALTNEAFARQLAQTSAGLRQAGFQQAQSAAQQDIASRMQASLANQAANLQAQTTTGAQSLEAQLANQAAMQQSALANQAAGLQAQTTTGAQALQAQLANQAAQQQARSFGAQATNAASLANQQAAMQAALANQSAGLAGSQQRLAAGAQLGNLANMGFGIGQAVTQQMAQQGAQQQALQQALIDAARGQFAGYTGAPASSIQYLSSALGATPVPQTQTTSRQPGLFDYLTLAASGAAAFSDSRLKEKVKRVGNLTPEIGLYEWEWNDEAKRIGVGDQATVGVIAQEVKDKIPGAVLLGEDGYFRVNYDKIAEAVR